MARILHVLTSPRAEGTPRLVLDWLNVTGHEQGVAFLSSEPADLREDFARTGCWLRVGEAVVPGPRKFPRIVWMAQRWVHEFHPDLVIAWPTGFSHWVFLGARLAGSRAALLAHAGNPPSKGWRHRYVMTWVCLWTIALCGGRLVSCSRYVQRQFAGIPLVPSSRVGFAYNSMRAEDIASRAAAARSARGTGERFRAIMVATLESHKDHVTLIRAARLLRDRGLPIEVSLAGAGRREAELRDLVNQLDVGGTVKFLGPRRDVPELLGQSDVFVLSTTPQEGFGIVLLEALAAGLPIIASDVEPVQEVLADGRWGMLVPVGDAGALADALAVAAERGKENEDLARARRVFAKSFSPERMVADYLAEARVSSAEPHGTLSVFNV